jgi:hypothetical protein
MSLLRHTPRRRSIYLPLKINLLFISHGFPACAGNDGYGMFASIAKINFFLGLPHP